MGGQSVFELRNASISAEEFNVFTVVQAFTIIIVVTMIAEHGIERFDHYAEQNRKIVKELRDKVVKELMILGLISFGIFVGEQVFKLQNTNYYLPLEVSEPAAHGQSPSPITMRCTHSSASVPSGREYRNDWATLWWCSRKTIGSMKTHDASRSGRRRASHAK